MYASLGGRRAFEDLITAVLDAGDLALTLYHQGGSSLKERLVGLVGGRRDSRETFWALREVGLDIARGETIGKFMTYYPEPHVFARSEKDLAVHIARQVGFSLERRYGPPMAYTANFRAA